MPCHCISHPVIHIVHCELLLFSGFLHCFSSKNGCCSPSSGMSRSKPTSQKPLTPPPMLLMASPSVSFPSCALGNTQAPCETHPHPVSRMSRSSSTTTLSQDLPSSPPQVVMIWSTPHGQLSAVTFTSTIMERIHASRWLPAAAK